MGDLPFKIHERVIQVEGHLYKYDECSDNNILVKQDLFLCIDRVSKAGPPGADWAYMINVVDMQGKVSFNRCEIKSQSNIQIMQLEQTLLWCCEPKLDGRINAYTFYIKYPETMDGLKGALTKALIERNNQEMFASQSPKSSSSAPEIDAAWLEAQLVADHVDVAMKDLSADDNDDFDIEQFNEEYLDKYEQESAAIGEEEAKRKNYFDFDDEEEAENDKDLDAGLRDGNNEETIQAQQYDRAFVTNGPVIRIYKNSQDLDKHTQKLDYVMHLPPLVNPKTGGYFEPKNLLLHNLESNMLFMDKADNNCLVNFDLEKGVVVETFDLKDKCNDGIKMVTNEARNAQSTPSQLFHGVSRQNMFTIDPRLNSKSRVAIDRPYKTDYQFSTISTSLAGGIAIGSDKGEIRLYKQVGQDAKTLLPGLGDPITAIEVNRDGQWVLATTKTYLLLIPTLCSNGKTGFDHRMGKEKPDPIRLALKASDMAKHGIKQIAFRAAKFNNFTVAGKDEVSIVTSTGDFLVIWNFSRIKKGLRPDYRIVKLLTTPVDNQFQLDHEEKILVTDDKQVGVKIRSKKEAFHY